MIAMYQRLSEYIVNKSKFVFAGEINIPPDKSISHRAVFLSSFNKDMTKITNLLLSDDVKTTMYSLGAIGVMFAENNGKFFTRGTGIREYLPSPETIDFLKEKVQKSMSFYATLKQRQFQNP